MHWCHTTNFYPDQYHRQSNHDNKTVNTETMISTGVDSINTGSWWSESGVSSAMCVSLRVWQWSWEDVTLTQHTEPDPEICNVSDDIDIIDDDDDDGANQLKLPEES